mmetsp:Transcript_8659/g.21826  ORF Transcript_8659/g.21826 Transcript_8659/m.21826 type:complete len:795 (-) Transcript_8659:46-2430(-)
MRRRRQLASAPVAFACIPFVFALFSVTPAYAAAMPRRHHRHGFTGAVLSPSRTRSTAYAEHRSDAEEARFAADTDSVHMFDDSNMMQVDVHADALVGRSSSNKIGSGSSSDTERSGILEVVNPLDKRYEIVIDEAINDPSDIWDNSLPWALVSEIHPAGVVSNINQGHVVWSDVAYLNIDVLFWLVLLALPVVLLAVVVLLMLFFSLTLESNRSESSPEDNCTPNAKVPSSPMASPSLDISGAHLTPRSQRMYAWWALFCRCIPCFVVFGLPVTIAAYTWPYPFEVFAVLRMLSAVYVLQYGVYMSTFGAATFARMTHSMAANFTGSDDSTATWADNQPVKQHKVLHWVIIPQYDEDVEVVIMTLNSIAQGPSASSSIGVVLAMEERDPKSAQKVELLKDRFDKHFLAILGTYHPPNLPNDPPGKASNLAWAFAELEQHIAREGQDVARVVLTVADADTEFHRNYFDILAQLYLQCDEEQRALRIWQSGVLHLKNYHRQPCVVATGSVFIAMNELAGLSDPNAMRCPYSTYSLSMQLAQHVGGWDPCWIAEDWHMGLKCFFMTKGKSSVQPIMLPTLNYTPEENSWFGTVLARWTQAKRHALGFSDLSYYFMVMPLLFNDSLSHPNGHQRAAALRDLLSMTLTGCAIMVKFVNTHVMLGISWVYLGGAMLLQVIATMHMQPNRYSEVLFSNANMCFVVMGLEGLLYTVIVMAVFVRFYGLVKNNIEAAHGWGSSFFSSNFRHFLYVTITMQICSPIFFIGTALATWRAAFLTAFTQTFEYETAAKPTSLTSVKQ